MKKHVRRYVALLLISLLVVATFGGTALAAKKGVSKAKSATLSDSAIQFGKWYSVAKKGTFVITLTDDSIVTLSWKNGDERVVFYRENYPYGYINDDIVQSHGAPKGSYRVSLAAGSYTLKVSAEEGSKAKYRVTAEKAVNAMNWGKKSAIEVAAKTTVKISQTIDNGYPRWYKITLPKAQVVRLYVQEDIMMYDSESNPIEINDHITPKKTEERLPAGTYYIQLVPYRDDFYSDAFDHGWGYYFTFKWK